VQNRILDNDQKHRHHSLSKFFSADMNLMDSWQS